MDGTIIEEVTSNQIIELLQQSKLPFSDIEESNSIFIGTYKENELIGCIGLELRGTIGLLRSLAVSDNQRGKGLALRLTDRMIEIAKSRSLESIYLLTTDAEKFFEKVGFNKTIKASAPDQIKETKQYSVICSESAVVMKIEI